MQGPQLLPHTCTIIYLYLEQLDDHTLWTPGLTCEDPLWSMDHILKTAGL